MARKAGFLSPRKAIYVFWEGESKEVYTKYLKKRFSNKATIIIHGEKGTFHTAKSYFRGNKRFQNNVKELDEIWFFFDTEIEKGGQWEENIRCLSDIISSRTKRNPLRIRLLMTTGCIEYWFLLHYERSAPAIATPADKDRIMKSVQVHMPSYKKGDYDSTASIAEHYPTALKNGKWVLERAGKDGMPERFPDNTFESDRWLFKGTHTFTTVHEALEMLINLP